MVSLTRGPARDSVTPTVQTVVRDTRRWSSRTPSVPAVSASVPARTGPRWYDLLIVAMVGLVDLFLNGVIGSDDSGAALVGGGTLPTWVVVTATYAAYVSLLWRRQRPWAVFLLVAAHALVVGVVFVLFHPVASVVLALFTVARHSPSRWANPALAVTAVLAVVQSVNTSRFTEGIDTWWEPLVMWSLLMLLFTVVWVAGRREYLARRRADHAEADRDAAAARAAEAERRRLARELHDILAHSVSAMMMQAAGAKALARTLPGGEAPALREAGTPTAPAERVVSALATIEATGAQSMRELHRLLGVLRAEGEVADQVERSGLDSLPALVATSRSSGLTVEVHTEGEPVPLDPSLDLAAYRVVQESLANAMKHGGDGATVDLFLTWLPEELRIRVRSQSGLVDLDAAPPSGGFGLSGLRERVTLAGGTFDAGAVADGFLTTATLPTRRAEEGAA